MYRDPLTGPIESLGSGAPGADTSEDGRCKCVVSCVCPRQNRNYHPNCKKKRSFQGSTTHFFILNKVHVHTRESHDKTLHWQVVYKTTSKL